MYSQHQAQYFAWQLTRRLDSADEDKLTGAIMDAQIDPEPASSGRSPICIPKPFIKWCNLGR